MCNALRMAERVAHISSAAAGQRIGITQVRPWVHEMADLTQRAVHLLDRTSQSAAMRKGQADALIGEVGEFALPGSA